MWLIKILPIFKIKAHVEKYRNDEIAQGLLKLFWTVYSEGKLQSCLKLRNFQNPLNKDKSVSPDLVRSSRTCPTIWVSGPVRSENSYAQSDWALLGIFAYFCIRFYYTAIKKKSYKLIGKLFWNWEKAITEKLGHSWFWYVSCWRCYGF